MTKKITVSAYLNNNMVGIMGFVSAPRLFECSGYVYALTTVMSDDTPNIKKVENEIKKLKHIKRVCKALIKQDVLMLKVEPFEDEGKYLAAVGYHANKSVNPLQKDITLHVPLQYINEDWETAIKSQIKELKRYAKLLNTEISIPIMSDDE